MSDLFVYLFRVPLVHFQDICRCIGYWQPLVLP